MKLANVITQSILLGVSLITIFLAILNNPAYEGGVKWKEVLIWTALVQFFVGLYQLINAIIVTIRKAVKKELSDYLKVYWMAVLIYTVVGVMLGVLFESVLKGSYSHTNSDRIYAYWFVSAWAIAIYYYVITIKDYVEHKTKSAPHA